MCIVYNSLNEFLFWLSDNELSLYDLTTTKSIYIE